MKAYEEDHRGTQIATDSHKSVIDTGVPQGV